MKVEVDASSSQMAERDGRRFQAEYRKRRLSKTISAVKTW